MFSPKWQYSQVPTSIRWYLYLQIHANHMCLKVAWRPKALNADGCALKQPRVFKANPIYLALAFEPLDQLPIATASNLST